jgi:Ni/Co efflux regulator RcnB
MKKRASKISRIILLAAAMLFTMPMTDYAQDHGKDNGEHRGHSERHDMDNHGRRDMDNGRKGKVVVRHDDNYREVIVKDRHVFYRGGAFYERRPSGYAVVDAPIGARIEILPGGYKIIRHNRLKYYLFGGIYYRFLPRERVYVVVSAPF